MRFLILLLLLTALTARADECEIMAKAFRVMAPKLSHALQLPLVGYDFLGEPKFSVEAEFAAGVDCEKLSAKQRDEVFLLLSDVDNIWHIAEQERGHPSLHQRAREATQAAVELLAYFPELYPFEKTANEVLTRFRVDFRYRFPEKTEVLLAQMLHSGTGVLTNLAEDVVWLKEFFGQEFPKATKAESRKWAERGARVVLHFAELQAMLARGRSSVRINKLLGALVDVLYGLPVETNYLISKSGHGLRVIDPRNTRLAFLINEVDAKETTQLRGFDQVPRELSLRLDAMLYPMLKKADRKQASALVLDRLWSLSFLWNPSFAYLRKGLRAYASPLASANLVRLINELYELEPKGAYVELMRLTGALRDSLASGTEWPALTVGDAVLHPDPSLVAAQLTTTLDTILNEVGESSSAEALGPVLSGENREARVSLDQQRFRLNAMRPENRVRSFRTKILNCADILIGE